MYLASDPWSRDTIILGDAWPWAFHNFANKRYRTAVDLVLTVLIDHCAACAASREEMSHWRGTALPANSFLEAGTNILDEPWKFLDPIPLIWHGESMSRYMMDQDTQDYWDTVIADECQQEINMIGSRSLSEPPPCLVSIVEDVHNNTAKFAEATFHATTVPVTPDEASYGAAFHDHGGTIAAQN